MHNIEVSIDLFKFQVRVKFVVLYKQHFKCFLLMPQRWVSNGCHKDATICPKDFLGKEALKELKSPYLDDGFLCVASI